MVPAGNKTKRLSSVNHTIITIHHHHHQKLKKILPTDQNRMIEQAKFLYYPLGKALENKQRQLRI